MLVAHKAAEEGPRGKKKALLAGSLRKDRKNTRGMGERRLSTPFGGGEQWNHYN